jgi:hypothetical protein
LISVWAKDTPVMMKSNVPLPLDAMNLLANVHTRVELERLEERLKVLQNQGLA